MTMYKRILVPTDGSKQAGRALEHAIALAKDGARLSVLHVDPSVALNEVSMIDVSRVLEAETHEIMDAAIAKLKEADVDFEALIGSGYPATVISKIANEREFDLIVMGSRGVGLMSEILLGSVSHSVAQHARCPVLIVK